MEAAIIYPHQLFAQSLLLQKVQHANLPVFLVEESLILTHNPIHRQKLIFHKLTLDNYEQFLRTQHITVHRLTIDTYPTTKTVFAHLKKVGIQKIHVEDTTDQYLENALNVCGLTRVWYESSLFLLPKKESVTRYIQSNRFMARFYKQLRIDHNILVFEGNKPIGGKWSFDDDNRKKLPKNTTLPQEITYYADPTVAAATTWAEGVATEQYGESGCWLPYTHKEAQTYLITFLHDRFSHFGDYEDAIASEHTRLFHSALSPLINVGLLLPQQVIDEAITYAQKHDIPINTLEGFVRQILGWREFIRAAYEVDGRKMRSSNFWKHDRKLPPSFWDGTTNIPPIDATIQKALSHGYTHHIERLMVLGNFMLLSRTDPDEVYRWFMSMYLDAYDWVMVPNVYGMSQFADGGLFATKPYISGSNYLKKMSDYASGDWEDLWTGLYWLFIATHQDFFMQNHRLSMMPRVLQNMDPEKRKKYLERASAYLR